VSVDRVNCLYCVCYSPCRLSRQGAALRVRCNACTRVRTGECTAQACALHLFEEWWQTVRLAHMMFQPVTAVNSQRKAHASPRCLCQRQPRPHPRLQPAGCAHLKALECLCRLRVLVHSAGNFCGGVHRDLSTCRVCARVRAPRALRLDASHSPTAEVLSGCRHIFAQTVLKNVVPKTITITLGVRGHLWQP
jgi:hypothetical protein